MIDAALARVTGYLTSAVDQLQRDAGYPVPVFRLTVDGNDIAQLISPRLIALDLTDNRGLEADQLSVTLSDHDGLLAIPPRGAVLHLWLGWSDSGLVDKGTYTVDETEHSGAPDVLSIRARSADLRKGLKVKRERSWSSPKTLGDVLTDIALGNNLKPVLAPALAGLPILQLDQANESDANLLTRLGEDFDAVATVKAGCLLCLPAGGGKTASGLALPHIILTRQDGDQHRYLQADRDSYDGVRAYFYDVNSAKKQEAIAGAKGDNLKDLRHTYSDRQRRPARCPRRVEPPAAWQRHAQLRARQRPGGPDPGADLHPAGREDGDRRDHLVRRQCAAQPQRRRRLHHQPGAGKQVARRTWSATWPTTPAATTPASSPTTGTRRAGRRRPSPRETRASRAACATCTAPRPARSGLSIENGSGYRNRRYD